jgi:hypothetical protein
MKASWPYNNEIFLVDEFLSKEEIDLIVKYLRMFFKDDPINISDEEFDALRETVMNKMDEVSERAINVFNKHHCIQEELEFTTFNNFVRVDGIGISAHHDNNRPGALKKVRYGCVLYLTDDFDGGELNYTELGIQYKPVAGQIIFHTGEEEYIHKVNNVSNGIRFTVAVFVLEK